MRFRLAIVAALVATPAWSATGQAVVEPPNPKRVALERQLRERTAQIARQRLGLTEAQMQQLERVNSRFAPQLNAVAMRERDTRRQLRQEMTAAGEPNQSRVSELLDASLNLQKQRIGLIEAEQKELAVFLTPVQRARYIALQSQFRNRAEQLARQRPGTGRGMRRNRPGSGRIR
jgi:protein CpxP